jgi:hypothetical protein
MAARERRAADARGITLTMSPSKKKKNDSGFFRVFDHYLRAHPSHGPPWEQPAGVHMINAIPDTAGTDKQRGSAAPMYVVFVFAPGQMALMLEDESPRNKTKLAKGKPSGVR